MAAAGLLGVPEMRPAAAQLSPDGDSADVCETVDLLLLMDRSTSLNSADRGGTQRRTALRSIRADLSGATGMGVALIGFNNRLSLHAESFDPAAEGGSAHPSDSELEESLVSPPRGGFTDYGVALRGALDMFHHNARPNSCRHLVWFTDGIHDIALPSTEDEVRQSEALRDEVCRDLAPAFADAGVSTQVVLLGNTFEKEMQSQNIFDQRVADLSAQIMSLITGDRVIEGLPVDSDCDGPLPVGGDVTGADDVVDLPNSLIEATARARGLFRWSDCENSADAVRPSDQLPAGEYIGEMDVLSYGGTIERYRVGEGEWVVMAPKSRRVRLIDSELDGLPPGWMLQVEVAADRGRNIGDVSLSCYSRPIGELLHMEAAAVDEAGRETSVLKQGERYDLSVDTSRYECPTGDFELSIQTLADQSLRSPECFEGSTRFGFNAVPAGEERQISRASGRLVPAHATILWPDDLGFEVEVDIPSRPIIVSGPLVCVQGEGLPRVESRGGTSLQGPYARIVAATCVVTPQSGGETTVAVESSADGPVYGMQTVDGRPVEQPFLPEDGPQELSIVSEQMGPGQLPRKPSVVTVAAELHSSDGPSRSMDSQTLHVGPAAPSPLECKSSGSGQAVVGSSGLVPRLESGSVTTSGRLVVNECEVSPPTDGQISVGVEGPLDGVDYGITDSDGNPLSQPLTLSSGDDPVTVLIVTEDLSNGGGDVTAVVEWQLTSGAEPATLHQAFEVPLIGDPPVLRCEPGEGLPRVPPELPLEVVAASCSVEAPSEGSITVEARATSSNLAYRVEALGHASETMLWRVAGGHDPLELNVVSEELGPKGWNYAGPVTLTVIVRPEAGVALIDRRTLEVPPGLLDQLLADLVRCGPMHLNNADGNEVPSEPLGATLQCESALRGPHGQLTLTLVEGPGSPSGGDGSGILDWRFLPASRLLNDGRGLMFEDGEEVTEVRLVTSGPLPNDRIEGDGTVVIEAQWMAPGWKEPLTGVTTAQYSVDLWPRSILWLAVLITLAGALLSWLLLYGVVAFTNRLPAANNFYARRFEISTYRDRRGGLRSVEIDSFNIEDHRSIPVNSDPNQKRLRSEDLRIDAKHPKWWQIASLLRGGWGQASAGQNRIVSVRPGGPRTRAGSTPERFTELAVVALDTRSGAAEPRGIAYVLAPRVPSERPDLRRNLADALAGLSGQRSTSTEPKPSRTERPR